MQYLTEARRLNSLELSLIRQVIQNAPPDAINLALGELGFTFPQILRHKAIEILQTSTPIYTPNAGITELRCAIAAQYPAADPNCVCVCNGAEEAVFLTLLSLLNPGDKVAIPDPDYPAYSAICHLLDAEVLRLPYGRDLASVDWQRWEQLLSQNVKVLIFSHPSNPCGHIFSEEETTNLTEICALYKVTMIVDEIYSHLYFEKKPPSFCGKQDALFLVGGLSKSHCMSGWRLGWVLAPPEHIDSIIKARQYVSTCSNWLSQQLASFALSQEGMKAVSEIMLKLAECRDLVLDVLHPYLDRVLVPPASPYLMLHIDEDDIIACQRLAQKGVICVPGSAFGAEAKSWMRINYAIPHEKLAQALEILCNELFIH